MKRIFLFLIAVTLALIIPMAVLADETNNTVPVSNVNLTVVIPSAKEISQEPAPEPIITPVILKLYPVSVYESHENGTRQVIKTYELSDSEIPADIPRDSFERDGWNYELTDIIKKENSLADVKEHTKTIAIDTDTKELDAIVKLLAPTVEHKSDDGYGGILALDVKSIAVETAGTKKNSFIVSAVREYPHLSSNDTSLVPKTITDSGRTLTLSGIEWRTQSSSSIDYQEMPNSYTAIATYTTIGSKTVVTGYSVTAKYKGTISKMIIGKTVYTAIFHGSKIPAVPVPIIEQQAESEVTEADILMEDIESPTEEATIVNKVVSNSTKKSNNFVLPTILFVISGLVFGSGFVFFILAKKFRKTDVSMIAELPTIEETAVKEIDEKGEQSV